jgi:hypothetical protein
MQRTTDAMPSMVLRVSNVVSYMLFILINTLSNKGYFGPTNADVSKDGYGCDTCYIRLYSLGSCSACVRSPGCSACIWPGMNMCTCRDVTAMTAILYCIPLKITLLLITAGQQAVLHTPDTRWVSSCCQPQHSTATSTAQPQQQVHSTV